MPAPPEALQPPPRDGEQSPAAAAEPEIAEDEETIETDSAPQVPIVGVVASAGGLEAFTLLASQFPAEPGFAVVIVQHLSPGFESALPELLSSQVRMPVRRIIDGMTVEPNNIYFAPSDTQAVVEKGVFRLLPRPTDIRQHSPGDAFLRSLADYAGERAIGVVLSGNAADGANGLRDIKAVGGLALVQDPQTAKFDGMPRSA
ncbi:MAG TPA: chemotaxis protein CheB, partial [Planctomycetaceae bacterium]|nr:chemotaxis protein CheB [Planctomycetaceae bacterium]